LRIAAEEDRTGHIMAGDDLYLRGYDHVEFYVGNAKQAAHFYDKSFGFKPVAKLGLETGCRDRASYVMQQGRMPLRADQRADARQRGRAALRPARRRREGDRAGDADCAARDAGGPGARRDDRPQPAQAFEG
jgi:catechol 2,3-dioxygenase-like lactoylglutathione lyase family enzyme